MSEKLPAPQTDRFPELLPGDVRTLPAGTLVGRIYASGGAHPRTWNGFRHWGPTGSRFDHQPPPARLHPELGIFYGAPELAGPDGAPYPVLCTCLAECFRDRGIIELSRDAPYFALFEITRPLRLLDLGDSDWVTRAGGNGGISSGVRSTSRLWAQAIYQHYTGADAPDGLIYPSSNIPVARSVAVWERGKSALPSRPSFNEPLGLTGLRAAVETFAARLDLPLAL